MQYSTSVIMSNDITPNNQNTFGMIKERNSTENFQASRWLEAVWDPGAGINTLPGQIDMFDMTGTGEGRLICADLGSPASNSIKIRVFKNSDQETEHNIADPPCAVVGFYSENGDPRSALLGVGAGPSVYIYKNMRAHFKYCLPPRDAHPKEREIWHKTGLSDDLSANALSDELELLLSEIGAAFLSPRTLKFLSLDSSQRTTFAEQYRRQPLIKPNCVTALTTVKKNSPSDPACSYLVVGSEAGEILIIDTSIFSLTDKFLIGWPPVELVSRGMWTGDGMVIAMGREGQIGSVKKGGKMKYWEKLPSPPVASTTSAGEEVAIAVMDGSLWGYSMRGNRLWKVQLPGIVLDLTSLPVPQNNLSLIAVSLAGFGVRIYDGKHHVDTLSVVEPVSAVKYGRLGQEERALAMVTVGGGLSVRILKRTADFGARKPVYMDQFDSGYRFSVPKRTQLFLEQSNRERNEAVKMYNTFQQGFLRLRVTTARKANEVLPLEQGTSSNVISMEASVLGLGPNYLVRLLVTNVSDVISDTELFIVCRDENTIVKPRVINLPLLPCGVPIPINVSATPKDKVPGKIVFLLCKKGVSKPLVFTSTVLPVPEEEIEV